MLGDQLYQGLTVIIEINHFWGGLTTLYQQQFVCVELDRSVNFSIHKAGVPQAYSKFVGCDYKLKSLNSCRSPQTYSVYKLKL